MAEEEKEKAWLVQRRKDKDRVKQRTTEDFVCCRAQGTGQEYSSGNGVGKKVMQRWKWGQRAV